MTVSSSTRFAVLLIVMIALILAVARPVSAVLIKTGVPTLFNDDFEDDTNGSAPAPNFDTSTLPTPGTPVPGEWNITTTFDTVTDALLPGAAQGTKYLHGVRTGTIGAYFSSVNSGTVSALFSVYIPTGSITDTLQVSLAPSYDGNAGISGAPVWLVNDHTGTTNHVFTYVGGVYTDTGLAYLEGQWQTWQVDYTFNTGNNNDDTFTISVGANNASFNAGGVFNITDPANLQYLNFRAGANGNSFYIDAPVAVPEPASLGVIGIGALFLTRRRAR